MSGNDSARFASFLRLTQFTLFGYKMYISPTNTPWTIEETINFRNSWTGKKVNMLFGQMFAKKLQKSRHEISINDSTHFGYFSHQTWFQPKSYTLTLTSIAIF